VSPHVDSILERPGLQKAIESFEKGRNVVLVAPTGYGKTILSTRLVRVVRERGLSAGLIHVVPYRALVRQIYEEKFKEAHSSVGYQSMDEVEPRDKSPYYLRELVVTTLDSFIYNLYRVPVAEMFKVVGGRETLGHYYPVLASIMTSTVVFDEAHVYLGAEVATGEEDERESLEFVLAALAYLSRAKVPVIVETATMHSSVIARVVEVLNRANRGVDVIYVGGRNLQVEGILRHLGEMPSTSVEVVEDREFYEGNAIEWATKLVGEEEALRAASELCRSEPVLVVRNTIARAVNTYNRLRDVCNAALIHSLLSNRDRERGLSEAKKIAERGSGVIVSTQVIEVGVEVATRVLVSDPAPVENLSQRAGRLCREKYRDIFEACREAGAEVYIIKGDPEKLAEVYNKDRVREVLGKLATEVAKGERRVDWRLLSTRSPGRVSFTDILEAASPPSLREPGELYKVAEYYLVSDATPKTLLGLLRSLGTWLSRSSVLLSVLIPPYEGREPDELELVAVDSSRLFKSELKSREKCLEYDNEGRPRVVLIGLAEGGRPVYITSHLRVGLEELAERKGFERLVRDLTSYIKPEGLSRVAGMYLLAKETCYQRGLGLVIWRTASA
jgi:CRISPR-associated endonuclease/helicase Cas3